MHILSIYHAKVFRGRKRNVLRLREDSFAASRDALLLATLLFTLGCFLLPTVAA
jgi:hypothetical protein